MDPTLSTLFVVVVAAMCAPIIVHSLHKPKLPVVVVEILLGILIGPQLLGFAQPTEFILLLRDFGIAFLFFMAGFEIDFERLEGLPLRLAIQGWLVGLAVAIVFGAVITTLGVSGSLVYIALAVTTTAIGTLMPILKDSGDTETPFGRYILAIGAIGEFGPIVLMALLLEPERSSLTSALVLTAFGLFVVCGLFAARRWHPERLIRVIRRTMNTSGQLAMRITIMLIVGFVVLAVRMELEFLLGAFAAGVLVAQAVKRVPDQGAHEVENLVTKYEGLGFGFFIPLFFVVSGITFDARALVGSATSLVLLPVFLAAFVLTRGLPVLLLYRGVLEATDRRRLGLLGSTQLPLVIAISGLGVESGKLSVEVATSMVGAAMVSVMVFPLLALGMRQKATPTVAFQPAD